MSGRAVALTLRDVRIAKIARMQKRARCLNELDNYLSAVDVIGSPTRYDLNNTASHLRNLADGMKGKKKDHIAVEMSQKDAKTRYQLSRYVKR